MKRRSFLGLLGIAPVAALAAKEAIKPEDHLAQIKQAIAETFPKINAPVVNYGKTDCHFITLTDSITVGDHVNSPSEWTWGEGETEFDGDWEGDE